LNAWTEEFTVKLEFGKLGLPAGQPLRRKHGRIRGLAVTVRSARPVGMSDAFDPNRNSTLISKSQQGSIVSHFGSQMLETKARSILTFSMYNCVRAMK
jgi:hypothetical protein